MLLQYEAVFLSCFMFVGSMHAAMTVKRLLCIESSDVAAV